MNTSQPRVVVLASFPPHDGGSAYSAVEVARGLREAGSPVCCVSPLNEERMYGEGVDDTLGINYIPCRYSAWRLPVGYVGYREFEHRFLAIAREFGPDCIVANNTGFAPAATAAAERLGITSVAVVRGTPCNTPNLANMDQTVIVELVEALRKADAVVAVAPHLVDTLKSQFGIDSIHIRNSPEISNLRALVTREKRMNQIAVVGTLTARKRPQDALRLCVGLSETANPLTLVYAGEGPLRDELQDLSKRIPGSRVSVRILGFLPRTQVLETMAESAMLIHPSLFEGDPRVVAEAQLLGIPTVIRKAQWSDHITKGVVRLTQEEIENPPECAASVLTTIALWEQLRADALEAFSDYTTDQMASGYLGVIRDILDCCR